MACRLLLAVFIVVVVAANGRPIKDQIDAVRSDADKIIDYVLNGEGKGQVWNDLAKFGDLFGARECGSKAHASAVDYLIELLTDLGLDNVHGETVTVPLWTRGFEAAWLIEPRPHKMNILGLGTSIGTDGQNVTAPVLVVDSFDELHEQAKAGNTQGKIIVYNQYCDWKSKPIDCYGVSVQYRSSGAAEAAKAGGVASLVKSPAAFSINSPHTGEQDYEDGVTKIPTACITLEDAAMLQRMQDRGQKIVISLFLDDQNLGSVNSTNVVAEWTGSTYPEQIVVVSGHSDGWLGTASMDDGGGLFISWKALAVLQALGLRPKRTIRFVGWSCEELGGIGSQQYYERHKANAGNYSLVMESDLGTFQALGIKFTGSKDAMQIMQQIGPLLAPINASLVTTGGEGTDIGWWMQGSGVPGASLANANDRYFWFHHSRGDTMDVQDPDAMDSCLITWAVTAYTVANLDSMLPRD